MQNGTIFRLGVAMLLFIGQQPTALAAPANKVWRIDYDRSGSLLSGPSTVYLSDNAIRIETGMYEMTASAPDWTAVIYSKTLNAYAVRTANKWRKQGFLMDSADSEDYLNPKSALRNEKVPYKGFATRKTTWKGVEMDQFYQVRSKNQACTIELYQTTSVPISKMQLEAIAMWYGVPYITGVPLLLQSILPNQMLIKLRALAFRSVPNTVSFKGPAKGRKLASTMDLIKGRYGAAIENMMLFNPSK